MERDKEKGFKIRWEKRRGNTLAFCLPWWHAHWIFESSLATGSRTCTKWLSLVDWGMHCRTVIMWASWHHCEMIKQRLVCLGWSGAEVEGEWEPEGGGAQWRMYQGHCVGLGHGGEWACMARAGWPGWGHVFSMYPRNGSIWGECNLLSHSPSSLRGPGGQERCPRTRERPMSLQSSKRARRRTQGTTGRSASPPSRERWWSSLSWGHHQTSGGKEGYQE